MAVLWQILFARCFHAEVNLLATALLVLAVWLIYAADRVMDAWTDTSNLPRHEFYRSYWRAVAPVWAVALALAGWLAWTRLARVIFERGLVLTAAVGLYFAAVHLAPAALRRAWPKEAAVAILFALGASVAAWSQVRSAGDIGAIFLFSCLCWINCAAIEQWEQRRPVKRPIGAAAMCVAAMSLAMMIEHRPVLSAAEAASAIAFLLLDRGRHRLSSDALRVLADVALLSPVFFLPVAGLLV
ncbi:MAG TPA: hypothetical protein VK419_16660 [Bryobacteraceae bacterium]|nr:hypothetical protein [Bryobacteraceae bacterium]